MKRDEAIAYLRGQNYSRRLSAKLADIALLRKTNSIFADAIKSALEKAKPKKKGKKIKGQDKQGNLGC
jgi:hypothetical protein